jgi:hypothetical protein
MHAVALACFLHAASLQAIPPSLLLAIWRVEGGLPGTVSRNGNGTTDLGVMQVNSVHLPRLAALYGRQETEVEARLRDDGCFNVQIAAFELARRIEARGGDVWAGVGDYHSSTPEFHWRYRHKVRDALRTLRAEGWTDGPD